MSCEARTGLGSEKASEANVPDELGEIQHTGNFGHKKAYKT